MTSSPTPAVLPDARAREVLADARIAAGSLLGDCPEPVAIAAMLAFAKEVTPPAITTTAIAAGIKAWTSGDAAPDDWDGGAVLLRNGSTMFPSKVSLAYHANGTNRWNHQRENRNPDWDIVAYSASAPKAASEDGATGLLREAARYAEDGYRCRTCMAVFVADPKDGIGGGHPDNGCTRPNWDKLEEAAQAAAIRALFTDATGQPRNMTDERERCAKVADAEASNIRNHADLATDSWQHGRLAMADTIAAAIRNMTDEGEGR